MLRFAVPILLANILQSLNASVNSIWVGRGLGKAAFAATTNANAVMFLLIAAAFGFALAATILVGQHIGAQDIREAKRTVGTSAVFFFGVSLVMSITGLVLTEPLLVAMQTPRESLPLAEQYMRVIFLALPCLYMYPFVGSLLRGGGDAKTPFYFMLLSVGLDITLNPVLIFGLGPAPRLGIAGSALSTFIAQAIALTSLIVYLYRRNHPLCLHKSELALLKPDNRIVRALVTKGIPMSAQMIVLSLGALLMITLVNECGVDTTAAYGDGLQIWNYIQMPAIAVGMAVSAMAAQNVGARKWDRVEKIASVGVLYSVLLTGTVVLLIEILDAHAFGVFFPGRQTLHIASHINHLVTWSYVFFGVTMVLFGVVRATGAVMTPLAILVFCLLIVRFPLAELLMPTYHADAIWWSFPISAALSAVLAFVYYRYGNWRSVQMLAPAAEPVVGEPSSGV